MAFINESSNNQPAAAESPLAISDPLGVYDFSVEVDATGCPEPHEINHNLTASRQYASVENITPVWPTLLDVAGVLEHLINIHVVDEDGEEVQGHGVTVTTVFQTTTGGGYRPVDVRFNGESIDSFDVSPGFWTVPTRLQSLIETQSTRRLTHRQLSFRGSDRRTHPPGALR
jgi:hypothetical protein